MICERAVLVSDCKPLKRIVQNAGCGEVFKAGNSKDMAKQILNMYQNQELMKKFGKNGKLAALGIYSWKHDAKRLESIMMKMSTTLKTK